MFRQQLKEPSPSTCGKLPLVLCISANKFRYLPCPGQGKSGIPGMVLLSPAIFFILFVCFVCFFGCTRSILKFLGQGSNESHSCDLRYSCSNAGSLTRCSGLGIEPMWLQTMLNLMCHSRNSCLQLPWSVSLECQGSLVW